VAIGVEDTAGVEIRGTDGIGTDGRGIGAGVLPEPATLEYPAGRFAVVP